MHTAQVTTWGQPPKYVFVPDLPAFAENEVQIKVLGSGLHNVVRSKASGTHYISGPLPHYPGIDGVGLNTNNELVFFSSYATGGAMADYINVPQHACCPVPAGLDAEQVAALVNPGLSSWLSVKKRTSNLPQKFTAVVLGATSASGALGAELLRALGAGKVIGVARSAENLAGVDVDERVLLRDEVGETDYGGLEGVDMVLDYVYGPHAVHLLSTLKVEKPLQYVQVGALGGELNMAIPGAILRGKDITVRGGGVGSWQMKDMIVETPLMLEAFKKIN
ncbi:hypothetical protein LTS18_001746 [Coniosporium uncinatum]|uniref:Uncharacterized protein n=1 Tax=Coniosporium uncinatum TaxID=93489 RepID=A0ACC3D7U1_9PEZI|nr:hypothetical protein LTS18_001746 [Coniosporium uncinatum]